MVLATVLLWLPWLGCATRGKTGRGGGDSADTACTPKVWYADEDGDAFGDSNTAIESCDHPDGTVLSDEDCDDGDAHVFPGAPELCQDGVVNDCGASAADAAEFCAGSGPFSLDGADGTMLGVSSNDAAGWRVEGAGDLNGDGSADLLVGAGSAWTIRVAEVLSPGVGTTSLDDAATKIYSETGSSGLGTGLSHAGDVDGDGLDDVLLGDGRAARAYLILSPVSGDMSAGDSDTVFTREELDEGLGSGLGHSVAGLGDTDGDGLPDLLLGAPSAQGLSVDSDLGDCASESTAEDEYGPGVWAGIAYLFTTQRRGAVDANEADARLLGEDAGDFAGAWVAGPGDMNGDGLADMAVVAQANCEGGENTGAIYAIDGPATGDLYLGDADGKVVGSPSASGFDIQFSAAGDVSGDGTPDLLSADSYDGDGTVYLFLGPVSGRMPMNRAVSARISGTSDASVGTIAAAGDLDLDGYDDILVGGQRSDGYGTTSILHGPLSGTLSLDAANQVFLGARGDPGQAVAGVGDSDGDGLPDVLVGATYANDAGSLSGAAYLLLSCGALLSGDGEI